VGVQAWRRRGGLTQKRAQGGPESSPLQHDQAPAADAHADLPTSRLVWERIYDRPLSDNDLAEIEGNLLRYIDLLASISGSILGAREWSMTNGDEAA
jgi:hypothetical protein